MKKTLLITAMGAMSAVFALAGNFSGILLDANCFAQSQKTIGCGATGTTTSFALNAGGKVYKLDDTGNQKAAAALKSRPDNVAEPGKPHSTEVSVKVDGMEKDGTIAATSVDIQ